MSNIIAMCEKRISEFDEHMADTYDLPSAINEIIIRCEAAEQRAAQLEDAKKLADYHFDLAIKDRDIASYQARMEAARIAYDAAQQFKADNCFDHMHAAMIIFRQIAGEYAEKK